MYLLACQSRVLSQDSAAQPPVLYQRGQDQIRVFGFYPNYESLVEFVAVRRGGESMTIIVNDGHVYALTDGLLKL